MKPTIWPIFGITMGVALISQPVFAHDPVFGIGPHVVFKDGMEAGFAVAQEKAGDEKETELSAEVVYGITSDWAAGIELPYASKDDGVDTSSGIADIQLFTKYRFWREDSKGLQESAAIMLAINGNNGDDNTKPKLGNGATDTILGLTYGYESIKWYRWASARYIRPGESAAGIRKGDKWLVDFVAGWRPVTPEYKKPDTVWLLELNTEITDQTEMLNGSLNANSGGTEVFLSPGIFWTIRNFSIKSGIQIPIASNLDGIQAESDYRFKTSFEWHL